MRFFVAGSIIDLFFDCYIFASPIFNNVSYHLHRFSCIAILRALEKRLTWISIFVTITLNKGHLFMNLGIQFILEIDYEDR